MPSKKSGLDAVIYVVIRATRLGYWMGFDDAVQALRLDAYDTWPAPEIVSPRLLWFVLYRRAIDHLRRLRGRCPELLLAGDEGDWAEALAGLEPEARPTAEQHAAAVEVLALLDAPGILDSRERSVIRRKFWHDETDAEIAVGEKCSRTNVQWILLKALAKLRTRS
jgi:DNA-directed RNA polymerase specialized sigma24 family protein